ncbi:MAG: hypothetical protein J0M34_00210 [Alphaproteobacteria bacterium]|nr:hypothetical protein [Alphaproteobacteria bacterium]
MSEGKIRLISTKQCKRARALLKWNPLDLASRTRIPIRHLEKFERNQARLTKPENDEIVKVFDRHGIEFLPDGEVILHAGISEFDTHETTKEFKHYNLDSGDATESDKDTASKEAEEAKRKREREEAERRKKQG